MESWSFRRGAEEWLLSVAFNWSATVYVEIFVVFCWTGSKQDFRRSQWKIACYVLLQICNCCKLANFHGLKFRCISRWPWNPRNLHTAEISVRTVLCYTLLSDSSEGVQSCSLCYLCTTKVAYNACSKLPFEGICLSVWTFLIGQETQNDNALSLFQKQKLVIADKPLVALELALELLPSHSWVLSVVVRFCLLRYHRFLQRQLNRFHKQNSRQLRLQVVLQPLLQCAW